MSHGMQLRRRQNRGGEDEDGGEWPNKRPNNASGASRPRTVSLSSDSTVNEGEISIQNVNEESDGTQTPEPRGDVVEGGVQGREAAVVGEEEWEQAIERVEQEQQQREQDPPQIEVVEPPRRRQQRDLVDVEYERYAAAQQAVRLYASSVSVGNGGGGAPPSGRPTLSLADRRAAASAAVGNGGGGAPRLTLSLADPRAAASAAVGNGGGGAPIQPPSQAPAAAAPAILSAVSNPLGVQPPSQAAAAAASAISSAVPNPLGAANTSANMLPSSGPTGGQTANRAPPAQRTLHAATEGPTRSDRLVYPDNMIGGTRAFSQHIQGLMQAVTPFTNDQYEVIREIVRAAEQEMMEQQTMYQGQQYAQRQHQVSQLVIQQHAQQHALQVAQHQAQIQALEAVHRHTEQVTQQYPQLLAQLQLQQAGALPPPAQARLQNMRNGINGQQQAPAAPVQNNPNPHPPNAARAGAPPNPLVAPTAAANAQHPPQGQGRTSIWINSIAENEKIEFEGLEADGTGAITIRIVRDDK